MYAALRGKIRIRVPRVRMYKTRCGRLEQHAAIIARFGAKGRAAKPLFERSLGIASPPHCTIG
jgi:hypothetical protein